jgi:hypothetical protein
MEPITFYRRMTNSNLILMKKYKYSQIKKLSYDDIIEIYKTNKIDFDLDVIRLKKFNQGDNKKNNIIGDIEDINLPKNEPENINTEESNITQTEDVNHLVITEDENISSTIEPVFKKINDSIEVTQIIQEIITTIIEKNILEDTLDDTSKDTSENKLDNKKYIEEYLDKKINKNKNNENSINMYYALFLIPILAFFLFVKK